MKAEDPAPADDLAALVARTQAAEQAGVSPAKIRMQLVQDGADPDQADLIVDQVYQDTPLHGRDHLSSRRTSAHATAGGRSEAWSWMIWGGGLLAVNGLSYALDWGFWIW